MSLRKKNAYANFSIYNYLPNTSDGDGRGWPGMESWV